MLDIKFIREHTEEVRQNLKNRHAQVDLDALLEADARRRELLGQVEAMKNRRNDVTKEISGRKDCGYERIGRRNRRFRR